MEEPFTFIGSFICCISSNSAMYFAVIMMFPFYFFSIASICVDSFLKRDLSFQCKEMLSMYDVDSFMADLQIFREGTLPRMSSSRR